MAKEVNQRVLGEFLAVTDTTLRDWQSEGMPIKRQGERGEENVYECRAVVDWMIERALARAGTARGRLELELLELQVREKRTQAELRDETLVPADQVKPIWETRVFAAAAFMMGRASRLAALLEATRGIEERRSALKREDADFLTRLGVDGARIQAEFEAFLAAQPAGVAEAFLARIAGTESDEEDK